jgi:rubrerythrin
MSELRQALRNAIEVERAAARFYGKLAALATQAEARSFLERLVVEETAHAEALAAKSAELVDGALPERADWRFETVETVPDWTLADDISFEQALQLALEAEQSAELFYDALASSTTGPVSEFFQNVARNEAQHVQAVAALIAKHRPG